MNCQIVSHTSAVFVHLSISVYLCFSTMDTQVLLSLYCHDTASTKWLQHLGLHIKSWGECCDGADKVPGQCWGAAVAAITPQDIKRLTTSTVISCVYSTLVKPRGITGTTQHIHQLLPKVALLVGGKIKVSLTELLCITNVLKQQVNFKSTYAADLELPPTTSPTLHHWPHLLHSWTWWQGYESTGSCAPHNL